MPTTKQLAALKDLQRAAGMTDDQWTAKFGDLSDQQLAAIADSTMATPVFHRKMNEMDSQIKAKDAEMAQYKADMDAKYSQEINRLGEIQTTLQQNGGSRHEIAAYQAKLKEIQTRYALDDAEVAVAVQNAQYQQQFQQPQNPYQPYQQPYSAQPAPQANQPAYITADDLKKAVEQAQANSNATLAINLKRNNEFIKEFGEPLDIDKVLGHANTYGVDVDTAIQEVYDLPAKRAARAQAAEDERFNKRLADERQKWEQSRATDGLFQADPNQAASVNAMKSVWNMKPVDAPVTTNGQVNVSDPARLADQARRGAEVLARLNS